MLFEEHCQAQNLVGTHAPVTPLVRRLLQSVGVGTLLRAVDRRARASARASQPHLGAPSRFAAGDWVRVLDATSIRATLDARGSLRGVCFVDQQWPYCRGVYRVHQPVRRLLDNRSGLRAVGRAVLLEGVTCGRAPTHRRWHRPIRRTRGMCAALAGQRVRVHKALTEVFELHRPRRVRVPVYLLDGLFCNGAVLGAAGPCDRGCRLLWHGRWLTDDDAPPSPPP